MRVERLIGKGRRERHVAGLVHGVKGARRDERRVRFVRAVDQHERIVAVLMPLNERHGAVAHQRRRMIRQGHHARTDPRLIVERLRVRLGALPSSGQFNADCACMRYRLVLLRGIRIEIEVAGNILAETPAVTAGAEVPFPV